SMPGYPLRRTSTRPSDGADQDQDQDQDQKPKRGGLRADLFFKPVSAVHINLWPCKNSNVGASLLAKADWHSLMMSTATTPSPQAAIFCF
ncbi:hypothetical protein, partial [Pseudomonas sp. BIC9C]|uniref:hypothetical protein n=1 Tax=Pseudomonas sp. BIC9C TaxID=3078458 RepID=UPI003A522E70